MLGSSIEGFVVVLLEVSLFVGCPDVVDAVSLAGVEVVPDGFDASIVERGSYDYLQTLPQSSLFLLRI